MPYCVAYGCTPNVRAAAETTGKKISYHNFPGSPKLRLAFGARIQHINMVLSKHPRLYSLYFANDSFL